MGRQSFAIIAVGLGLLAGCTPASTVDPSAPLPVPADAQTQQTGVQLPTADTACAIRGGWSTDPDPAGLNVRAAPDAKAPVLGVLPPAREVAEFERLMNSSFGIASVRDGWVEISDPADPEGKPVAGLSGGWISARFAGFDLQTDLAFAQPDPASPIVAQTLYPGGREQRFGYKDLAACRGEWVQMTFVRQDGAEVSGWARGVCEGQETSCDGARGDHPPL